MFEVIGKWVAGHIDDHQHNQVFHIGGFHLGHFIIVDIKFVTLEPVGGVCNDKGKLFFFLAVQQCNRHHIP